MTSAPARAGIAALTLTALGGSFWAGTAWDDRPNLPERAVAAPKLPMSDDYPEGSLVRAGSCDELLDWYVDNSLDMVTEWGWGGVGVRHYLEAGDTALNGAVADNFLQKGARAPRDLGSVTSSKTGTNVQEAGVDEPDVVKTNGELLVRIEGDDLTMYDVRGDAVKRVSTLDLPGRKRDLTELLMVGDEVVVLSQRQDYHDYGTSTARTVVRRVDLSDPAEPEIVETQTYSASLLSARLYDDTVRLVLSKGLPDLDFVQPGEHRTRKEALEHNRQVVRDSTIADWLPSVTDGDSDPEPAVGCDAMTRPEDFSGAGSVVVVGYDPDSPTARSAMGVATSSSTVYSSLDRLYLATSAGWWGGPVPFMGSSRIAPDWGGEEGVTELHAFELDGRDATYVGSGEVEGMVRDRWAMDSADGILRVAVGPTSETGNFNSVVTFEEEDGELVELGRVDRLGVNEQIKSVRWTDDLAIVVTFRQTDPLYAIDLTDPAQPKTLGKLKIPGFSEYLHPIGGDRLIGMGTKATMRGQTQGAQAAVFDLTDLTAPKQLSVHGYGQRKQALAGQDPRQFTWLEDKQTALTVVSQWGDSGGATGWISVLEVGADGSLANTMLPGTYGYDDIAHLRTVPLPDGRVVLVTEKDAKFLTF